MKTNLKTLIEKNFTKHFYCSIENKEFIFSGSGDGLLFNIEYTSDIGNILIETLENEQFIISNVTACISKINKDNYTNDEINNQNIVLLHLEELQKNLELSNINYFKYINFPKYIFKNFSLSSNDNTSVSDIKYRKNVIIEFIYKSFKDFALQELQNFLVELKWVHLNLIVYSLKDYEKNIINKVFNFKAKEFNDLDYVKQTYITNSYRDFYNLSCISKLAIYNNETLYLQSDLSELILEKDITDFIYVDFFEFNTLTDLLNLSLVRIITQKSKINICLNCFNFFIPESKINEKYCNRISPQNPNKSCKEYGAKRTYREQMKEKPITSEHNRTSQFYRMKLSRAQKKGNKEMIIYYKNKLKDYMENYNIKLEACRRGDLSDEDLIKWIINVKEEEIKNGSIRNNKK